MESSKYHVLCSRNVAIAKPPSPSPSYLKPPIQFHSLILQPLTSPRCHFPTSLLQQILLPVLFLTTIWLTVYAAKPAGLYLAYAEWSGLCLIAVPKVFLQLINREEVVQSLQVLVDCISYAVSSNNDGTSLLTGV
jgi:hypothetical protein